MKKQKIDYYLIAFAEDYYRRKGYEPIDAPWLVKEEYGNLTKPNWKRNFWVKNRVLVGSAEQSFIELFFEGKLKSGKFVATTPCFRDEPRAGWLHQNYFLKTELIEVGDVGSTNLEQIVSDAKDFFTLFVKTKVVKTGSKSFDIVESVSGVEMGSYGLTSIIYEGKEMKYIWNRLCITETEYDDC